ncbi:MAG: hypothetical protein ABFD05_00670, partial [Anaerolineaceae bacterium]
MTRLTNSWLDFLLNPEAGTFFLESRRFPGACLKNAGYNLSFSSSAFHPTARLESISQEQRADSKHGLLDIVSAVYRAK